MSVKKYIGGLFGEKTETLGQIEEGWTRVLERYQAAIREASNQVKKKFELSSWAATWMAVPLGIPYGIYHLYAYIQKKIEINAVDRKEIDRCIDEYYETLDYAHDTLIKLKGIEAVINKQDQIDEIIKSTPLTCDTYWMLKETAYLRINSIRKIYGEKDWDARVDFLTDKFLDSLDDVDRRWLFFALLSDLKKHDLTYFSTTSAATLVDLKIPLSRVLLQAALFKLEFGYGE